MQIQAKLYESVLQRFGIPSSSSNTSELLDVLLTHYKETVPWETVSGILRTHEISERARWPRGALTFWRDFLAHGTGGTCFESNLAFFGLLSYLGIRCYLTLCSTANDSVQHSAVVAVADTQKYLVDAGWWIDRPLLLSADSKCVSENRVWWFSSEPIAHNTYRISRLRSRSSTASYTLHDEPVSFAKYWQRCVATYQLFLDRLVISRLTKAGFLRFESGMGLEVKNKEGSQLVNLSELDLSTIPGLFGLSSTLFKQAYHILQITPQSEAATQSDPTCETLVTT